MRVLCSVFLVGMICNQHCFFHCTLGSFWHLFRRDWY